MRYIIVVLCLFLYTGMHAITTVIVELDEILFTVQEASVQSKLGKYSADHYIKRLFDIVNTVEVPYQPAPVFYKEYLLPAAWRLYLLNEYSSNIMHQKVTKAIKEQTSWLWPERAILLHAASIAFNPQKEVAQLVPLTQGHALIQECARKNKVQLFLFTNKNSETMQVLKENYPDFFALFKEIIISGQLKQLKPSKQAYAALIRKYKLDPATCYVIDTKRDYLTAAQNLGMTCLSCPHKDFSQLRQQLMRHKLI